MDEPANRLSCGSTDQCCHVPYAHRHCEHCNQVIALAPPVCTRQHYPGWPTYPLGQPYWWTNTASPVSIVGDSVGGFVHQGTNNTASDTAGEQLRSLTSDFSAQHALPTHACETP